jgi:hypothetical protein
MREIHALGVKFSRNQPRQVDHLRVFTLFSSNFHENWFPDRLALALLTIPQ